MRLVISCTKHVCGFHQYVSLIYWSWELLNSPCSKWLMILRITAFKKYFPFHTGWDVTDWILVFLLEQFFVTVFANIGCKSELETQTPLWENMGGKLQSCQTQQSNCHRRPKGIRSKVTVNNFSTAFNYSQMVWSPSYGEGILTRFNLCKFPLHPKFLGPWCYRRQEKPEKASPCNESYLNPAVIEFFFFSTAICGIYFKLRIPRRVTQSPHLLLRAASSWAKPRESCGGAGHMTTAPTLPSPCGHHRNVSESNLATKNRAIHMFISFTHPALKTLLDNHPNWGEGFQGAHGPLSKTVKLHFEIT